MYDYSKRFIDYKNRKPKPNNYSDKIYFRISQDLKNKLIAESERTDTTISEIIRKALENYLQRSRR